MLPFHNFSQDLLNHMLPGQRALQDILLASDSETVTSGACSTTLPISELSITGTKAYTLADGPTGVAGMRKRIVCSVAASIPVGTLTIASPETTTGFACASTFVFTTVGQAIDLLWTGTKWRALRVQRAGVIQVDVGVTVLTGYNLALVYALLVDGTDTSTGTKGLPNGSSIGERCTVSCALAANIPVGNIDGTFTGMLGNAYTHLGAIGVVATASVVGDCALLEWDGSSWQVMFQNGCTLS